MQSIETDLFLNRTIKITVNKGVLVQMGYYTHIIVSMGDCHGITTDQTKLHNDDVIYSYAISKLAMK